MASVSGTSSTSSSTDYSRITGLASGMDVDEIVESMSLAEKNKINKVQQQITTNEWKTEAYRDLISKASAFSSKYLSFTSADNMRSTTAYSSYSVTAKGGASSYMDVSISSSGGAAAASQMVIRGVSSVASAAHYSTGAITKDTFTASSAITSTTTTNNIKGQTIGFKIGDGSTTTLTFSSETIEDAVAELNDKLGDSFTASYQDGTFKIEANGSDTLTFTGSTSNMEKLFGIYASDKTEEVDGATINHSQTVVTSENAFSSAVDEANVTSVSSVIDNVVGKNITLNYSGLSKTISIREDDINEYLTNNAGSLSSDNDVNTANAIAYAMQKSADKAFGAGRINVGVSDNNELTLKTASNTSTLSITSADSVLTSALGLKTSASNRAGTSDLAVKDINFNTSLDTSVSEYKLSVNDVELTFSKDDTVSDIMSKINSSGAGITVSYSHTSNSFSFVSNETGSQGRIEINDITGNLSEAMFGSSSISSNNGTDTVMDVSFDGGNTFNTVTRSSSSVNLDGVSMKLDSNIVDADFSKPISFVASNDTDKIVTKIKDMITDYNALITELNTASRTRPNSDYSPLTDDQKAEMTDDQIKTWEEKAKVGILYGDSVLRSMASELSSAVTNLVGDVGLSSSIGISLSSDYTKGGIIDIDEDKLKQAVTSDPDKVISMFTNSTSTSKGIAERMKTVMDKYVGTSIQSNTISRSRGLLINKAGLKDGMSATDNELNDQLTALKEKLEKLQDKYDAKREKLFNKFSYLESYINQQNTMSSWLSAQMGY